MIAKTKEINKQAGHGRLIQIDENFHLRNTFICFDLNLNANNCLYYVKQNLIFMLSKERENDIS